MKDTHKKLNDILQRGTADLHKTAPMAILDNCSAEKVRATHLGKHETASLKRFLYLNKIMICHLVDAFI